MFNLLNFYSFADSRVSELVDKLDVIGARKSEMDQLLEKQEKHSREVNQRAVNKGKRLDYAKEVRFCLSLVSSNFILCLCSIVLALFIYHHLIK